MASSRDAERTDEYAARTDLSGPIKPDVASPRISAFWEGGSLSLVLPRSGSITIGRSSSCDVRIDHTTVSRRHAVVHVGAVHSIEDAGSANGTRVAGRLIGADPVPVALGEIIELGAVVVVIQSGEAGLADFVSPSRSPAARPGRTMPPPSAMIAAPPGARANEPAMQRLERLVKLVAAGNVHVLVMGEKGVGKEVVAERIHRSSRRANALFQRVEAATVAGPLLDRELFGEGEAPGLIEAADGGTVFIDDVSELPLDTQVRLVRVLERGEVIPIDAAKPRKVDVRVIGASSLDLRARIAAGTFREDLYFRLNGITIEVPPLRERREQIAQIAGELLAEACVEAARAPMALTKEAIARLESYDWPGNVRELKNAIDRALLLTQSGDTIDPEALPAGGTSEGGDRARLRSDLAAFERERIVEALEKCAGNQTKAAQLLGISRRTLVSRLGEYNLPRPRGGGGQR